MLLLSHGNFRKILFLNGAIGIQNQIVVLKSVYRITISFSLEIWFWPSNLGKVITDEVSCSGGNVDSSGEPEIMILEEWIIGFIAYNQLYVTFFLHANTKFNTQITRIFTQHLLKRRRLELWSLTTDKVILVLIANITLHGRNCVNGYVRMVE